MSVLDDHDPLCRSYYRGLIPHDECTDCALIRRVRADERTQILAAAGLTWDTATEALQATQTAQEPGPPDHPTGTPI